ncbi:MAG: FliM/FliN family flagellar motor C-terminal domain-containing protein [Acidobacteriia bacterium]|nr:FliM/FliN family flagellar motor C-terminal domain-containing protein [Terriglobia bacterium]
MTSVQQLPPAPAQEETIGWSPEILALDCQLSVEIAVPHFTVRELLRLNRGSIVATQTKQAVDVPLLANGEMLGVAELDVVNGNLAARITEVL